VRTGGLPGGFSRALAVALGFLATAGPAQAELALLQNGQVLKVESWRDEGGLLVLQLPGGGEIGVAPGQLRELLPDEIPPALPAEPAAPATAPASLGRSGLRDLASRVAQRHGVEPALVLAVIAVESAFHPTAVSPKGARGLMQLMPRTAEELGVRDAFDPEQNLDGGVRHLRGLLGRYQGDLTRTLAAYNAGAASVERHGGVPPFRETRDYVAAVMRRYRESGE
jgi:soluble lytic murein transglycosylase-like protein